MSSKLLKSTGIFGGMTLISRVLGFVRDALMASLLGAGFVVDAFLVAYKIPNFMRRLFAEGAFSQSFVPVFTETKTKQTHEEVQQLVNVVAGTFAAVLAVITLIGVIGAPLLIRLFAPGFGDEPHKHGLAVDLLRVMFPFLMFVSLTAFASGVLNSYGQFGRAALAPVILNLCMIAAMLLYAPAIQPLGWAVLLAGVLQLAFLMPAMARLNLLPRPRIAWSDPRVRRIIRLMLPILFGSSVAQIALLLDTVIASFLVTGSVSWLYFADRLMEFPLGLFSVAIGTVILPSLAAQHAARSSEEFSATLDWGLRMLLLVGLPAALGLFLLADHLTCALFEYRRFTAHDTSMTAWALMAYSIGFLGFSMVKVLLPGFYSRQETRLPVRYGIIALCCGMTMNVGFVLLLKWQQFEAPHAGIALGTSLSGCINAALLYRRLRKDGVYRPGAGWGGFGLRLLLANLALAVVVLLLAGDIAEWQVLHAGGRALKVAEVIGLAGLVYFGTLWVCGLRPVHLRHVRPPVQ
jgi:putative peptidoglycan lipid II flippase